MNTRWKVLLICSLLVSTGCSGASSASQEQSRAPKDRAHRDDDETATTDETVAQAMDRFTMEGFAPNGTKRWDMEGSGATIDEGVVSVRRPVAKGYDTARTAFLRAEMAHINQTNKRIKLEKDVSIHTSDGLWLETSLMYWLPDQDEFVTDHPIRMETDHMLIRGRGATGKTQMKTAAVLRDVEVILNPTTNELPDQIHHVKITCDGPLSFDYEHNVATFERNVHVTDPQGELYSSKLVAYMDSSTRMIAYAEAMGQVRIVQGGHTATGGRAVYEPAKGKITLLDSPSLLITLDDNSQHQLPALSLGIPEGRSSRKTP